MDSLTLLLILIICVLAAFSLGIGFYCFKINKKFDTVLEKGNITDFKDVILRHKEKNDSLELSLEQAFTRIRELEDISQISIQKTAVVRFNPFNDLSNGQSFVAAFLDRNNNGFVISSMFVKEGNRVFAKAIKAGQSEILLSGEELQALEEAMGREIKQPSLKKLTKKHVAKKRSKKT